MQPYDKLIMEALKGETPKEKYEYLRDMQQLLHKVAFPGRGLPEERWEVMDVVKEINEKQLVEWQGEYKY
jgi:hypothetical protein